MDGQIKIRGHRVELGEIEGTLAGHGQVRQAAVKWEAQEGGDGRLVGYVVGPPVEDTELRSYLAKSLPEYMIPGVFVRLEAMPLTPNGKLDRKALPPAGETVEASVVAPRTAAEEIVAGIWANILRVERVGRDDNFFALGGHSLLATQVISRARDVFGIELPLRVLFDSPTPAGMAAELAKARQGQSPATGAITPAVDGPAPLSFAQERLWFLAQLDPESAAYNIPRMLELKGRLDLGALLRSFDEVIRRHSVLRTTFVTQGDVPFAVVAPTRAMRLPVVDLAVLAATGRQSAASELARAEAERPFDLSAGPLIRGTMLRLAEDQWILLVTMHHIITDGWSTGVLVRELSALYKAFRAGEPSPLAPLAVQYCDFASWQRHWLSGATLERELLYWRRQLDGVAMLEFPTDFPRRISARPPAANLHFLLAPECAAGIHALNRAESVSLFMTLLAAWQTLLARYCQQADIAVGTPIANRNRLETEPLIGFFVNTLVLRSTVSGGLTFRELLAQTRRSMLDAYDHQDVPFERLVEELAPERDMVRSPLFQVMLALQNAPREDLDLGELRISAVEPAATQAKFELMLTMDERRDGSIAGHLEYAADLFLGATMQRFIGHWRNLLSSALKSPDRPLRELDILSEAERRELLFGCNRTDSEDPPGNVLTWIARRTADHPDRVAVGDSITRLTYSALEDRANRIAQVLSTFVVKPETHIGVYLRRSPELVACLLGVLKAGAVFVPLDPAYPADRLRYVIEDAHLELIVSDEALASGLPHSSARLLLLDVELPAARTATFPAAAPNQLAYIIYTSGSTGKPKGAMVEYRGMNTHIRSKLEDLEFGPGDVLAQSASSSFDVCVWQMLGPLVRGGRVEIVDDEAAQDPALLAAVAVSSGVTVLQVVPAMLAMLAMQEDRLGAVRWIITNAEAAPAAVCAEWLRRFPEVALMNAYGATECSDDNSHYKIREPLPEGVPYAPAGIPLRNTRFYIVDEDFQPVPCGVAGELLIGGSAVGRGYLSRPELTAEKFLPDPFGGESGARVYRTHDRAKRWPNGVVEFLGRIDHLVKIRGHRIEPAELEAVAQQHADVAQALVVVRDAAGAASLTLYIVPRPGSQPLPRALAAYLKERVPAYMAPAAIIVLERFPFTPNGKVDRAALPVPGTGKGNAGALPESQIEQVAAAVWSGVLGVSAIGRHDDFFALGGHSLLATQVISRLRRILDIEIPLKTLFQAPTISEFAEWIGRDQKYGARVGEPDIVPVPRTGDLPLSYAQQRLWFLSQMEPESTAYHMTWVLRLSGALAVVALRRSITEIVRRHEVLRTSFPAREGKPEQRIAEASPVPLPVIDVSALGEAHAMEAARQLMRQQGWRPFDLARGPLVRTLLLRVGEESHLLIAGMHHIVGDGWSMGIVSQELSQLYRFYVRGEESPLEELPIQYADFAVWQRAWLEAGALARQMEYWRRQLAGLQPLELPADYPRPAVANYRAGHLRWRWGREESQAVKVFGRERGVTLFMTLLAGWQALLSRYAGQSEVVVGTPIANRNRLETEGLIGFFVNTLVLRGQVQSSRGFGELLEQTRPLVLDAYAHQDVPFERLVEELEPQRDLSRSPLFQVMFALQNAPGSDLELGGVRLERMETEAGGAKFELTLSVVENAGGELEGELEYAADLFEPATVERMMRHWRQLLLAGVSEPERAVGSLELMSAEERRGVLEAARGVRRENAAVGVR
jgi:amino acid adenylation domain-containing protein